MITYKAYKQKLYNSYNRNKKLYREIKEYARVWNHCIALHKRYYSLYKKHLSLNKIKKHITKINIPCVSALFCLNFYQFDFTFTYFISHAYKNV